MKIQMGKCDQCRSTVLVIGPSDDKPRTIITGCRCRNPNLLEIVGMDLDNKATESFIEEVEHIAEKE